MEDYILSLRNPFSQKVLQPKLHDGKVTRSAGLKLRATGEIVCDTAGTTYIALIPALNNAICWKTDPSLQTTPPPYTGHLEDAVNRGFVKQARLIGAGLKLTLNNSAVENEGYFEAARVQLAKEDFTIDSTTGVIDLPLLTTGVDIAMHQTYMTGKLRDIHTLLFRLNMENTDNDLTPITEPPTTDSMLSKAFDCVIIKVHGRVDSTSPSVLMFDVVSNEELVYRENTALSRLMTPAARVPEFENVQQQVKISWPGVQFRF
jgi:hypothetical protein